MSDRNYTSIKVSGPNAAVAEEAAKNFLRADGGWWERRDCFFDHNSGDTAITTIAQVSREFPTETFSLFVNGGMAEGRQGPVEITNGKVADGRSAQLAHAHPTPEYCRFHR